MSEPTPQQIAADQVAWSEEIERRIARLELSRRGHNKRFSAHDRRLDALEGREGGIEDAHTESVRAVRSWRERAETAERERDKYRELLSSTIRERTDAITERDEWQDKHLAADAEARENVSEENARSGIKTHRMQIVDMVAAIQHPGYVPWQNWDEQNERAYAAETALADARRERDAANRSYDREMDKHIACEAERDAARALIERIRHAASLSLAEGGGYLNAESLLSMLPALDSTGQEAPDA